MRKARLHTLLRYIAANVQAMRAARGLTQLELAERAELDLRHLQRIERASVNLSLGALISLADSLGVAPSALFEPADLAPPRVGRPRNLVELGVLVPSPVAAAGGVAPPQSHRAPGRSRLRKAPAKNRHRPRP